MSNRNALIALLLAGVETTEGTDPGLTAAANAIQILELLEPGTEHAFKHARDKMIVGAAIQAMPPLKPKGRVGTWQNTVHVRGTRAGTAYSASNLPEIDPFLRSAGMSATLVTTAGSESVTYKPAATALPSHAEYYYVDGRLFKLLAAKTEVDFAFDAGGPLVATIKRTGLRQIATDAALPAGAVFGTTLAPVADNVALALNFGSAFSAGVIRKFGLTSGNKIAQRPNANAVGSLAPHKIRERKPTFTITLEDELAATIDFETLKDNATSGSLSFTIGGTKYNQVTVTLPGAVIEDVKYGDDNGTQLTTISGGCYDSVAAANDALQLLFN